MLTVVLSFKIFVTELTYSNNYPNRRATDIDPKLPFVGLNASNGVLLRELPACAVGIYTTHIKDALMWVWSIGFIDALYLMIISHDYSKR